MKLTAADLKTIRKYYAISQQQLAEKLGVTQSLVAHWEREAVDIPDYVSARLGIDTAQLHAIYEALAERQNFLNATVIYPSEKPR